MVSAFLLGNWVSTSLGPCPAPSLTGQTPAPQRRLASAAGSTASASASRRSAPQPPTHGAHRWTGPGPAARPRPRVLASRGRTRCGLSGGLVAPSSRISSRAEEAVLLPRAGRRRRTTEMGARTRAEPTRRSRSTLRTGPSGSQMRTLMQVAREGEKLLPRPGERAYSCNCTTQLGALYGCGTGTWPGQTTPGQAVMRHLSQF